MPPCPETCFMGVWCISRKIADDLECVWRGILMDWKREKWNHRNRFLKGQCPPPFLGGCDALVGRYYSPRLINIVIGTIPYICSPYLVSPKNKLLSTFLRNNVPSFGTFADVLKCVWKNILMDCKKEKWNPRNRFLKGAMPPKTCFMVVMIH